MHFYTKSVKQTLEELDTNENGLPLSDAAERLQRYGRNEIKVTGDPLWRKLIEPFANVFMLVLFIAVGISIFHGDYLDASIISVIIAISAVIYYVQRFSTERILRSLRQHDLHMVETLRDGKFIEVDSTELVPGDIIALHEGEKIPADARLLETHSLRVDEAQLTGESLPVSKQTAALHGAKEVYERDNMLFQGSFVVAGDAKAIIVATGNESEFGQLAALTQNNTSASPVQQKIDKLITQIIGVVAAVAVVAFTLSMLRGIEFTESLKFVIALSVSAVPESLPVAISVILVLGMRRMAAKKALVRTMRSIETIGVITTIATDKTGTLTKNQLTVQEIWQPIHRANFTEYLYKSINHASQKFHDPLDTAFSNYISEQRMTPPTQPAMASLPFDQEFAMSGNIWHHGSHYMLHVKGAPEHVLAKCDITENEHEKATAKLHSLTGNGYRVIALAHTTLDTPIDGFKALPKKHRLTFDGFIAVADVLRPEAKKSIRAALDAGITVRMITGDHFETAYHIGRQLGMVKHRDQVFDSRRMNVMSDEELEKVISNIRVFSRVIPEHKYRILALLKKNNITAMTGDGVNDVPALANSHVGVAMGSGSQIAKDAGDIILLDDNFKSIVDAMKEGRTIYANVQRMLFYLLATSAGQVITLIGSLIIGLPVPLVPVQILWINLVTDSALVIPLGLEPGEESNMKKKPKKANAPILSRTIIWRMVLVALSMAVLALSLYVIFSNVYGHEYGRTIAFSALVVMQWSNAFNARSDDESLFKRLRVFNGKFYFGLALAVILQMMALFGPLQDVLYVTPVAIGDLFITGLIAFATPIVLVEIHKYFSRKYFTPKQEAREELAS